MGNATGTSAKVEKPADPDLPSSLDSDYSPDFDEDLTSPIDINECPPTESDVPISAEAPPPAKLVKKSAPRVVRTSHQIVSGQVFPVEIFCIIFSLLPENHCHRYVLLSFIARLLIELYRWSLASKWSQAHLTAVLSELFLPYGGYIPILYYYVNISCSYSFLQKFSKFEARIDEKAAGLSANLHQSYSTPNRLCKRSTDHFSARSHR